MSELHTTRGTLKGTLLFHLNLSYSAIEVEQRAEVVQRAYGPMLALAEEHPWLRMAVEATGHTLERIAELDPEWILRLRVLMGQGRVEFVGSGDTQLIGPLVPSKVNHWNQRLGQETYEHLLGRRPTCALVNEMAWSQGIIDHYRDAGYETLVMEWNNPRRTHPEWDNEWRYGTAWSESPRGRKIAVSWADAIAFQKFQRAVLEDAPIPEYLDWVDSQRGTSPRHIYLYASDAEVFDFRPGRYHTEVPISVEGEWRRIGRIVRGLHRRGVEFTTPSALRSDPEFLPGPTLCLRSVGDPIPVKKQPKYNVTRWALSGRDDVGLNARCFERADMLEETDAPAEDWRDLCRMWASDLRTHLTESRWNAVRAALPSDGPTEPLRLADVELERAEVEREGGLLRVETDGVSLLLNPRRGLAVDSLVFRACGEKPLIGTLPHGHFDHIDWAADFYSGHTVLEMPARSRVTDLERVEPKVRTTATFVEVRAEVPTSLGPLPKHVRVFADRVEFYYGFSSWRERPLGSLRTGMITLMTESLDGPIAVTCKNGGDSESFPVFGECDHGKSVSPLISAGAAFGATDGRLAIDDGRVGFELSWCQAHAAALPLMTCREVDGKRFLRLGFSLIEIDETHRPGAPLRDFRLEVRPRRAA